MNAGKELRYPYGLDDAFWGRIHKRVTINQLTVEQFAEAIMRGTLGDYFLAKVVRQVAQEFRDALLERGDWTEMELVAVNGRKSDMIVGMQRAVHQLLMAQGPLHSAAPSDTACGLLRVPSTIPPMTPLSSSTMAPGPTASAVPRHVPPPTPTPAPAPAPMPIPTPDQRSLLLALNRWAPPFFRMLCIVKSVSLHYGSTPIKFQVPVHFADGVHARRLRVLVLPFQQTPEAISPYKWPAIKDIFIYVNDQKVQSSWRRAWPERASGVAKSLLPLDITQFLVLGGVAPQQRLKIDIFHKEFATSAAIVIAEVFSIEDVAGRIVSRELRGIEPVGVQAALRQPPPLQLVDNTRRLEALYNTVVDAGAEEEDIVADDPVVSTFCPLTRGPMKVPVRGAHCNHVQCVDLTNYLVTCQRASYWNCTVCDAEMREEHICIDTLLWEFLVLARDKPGGLPVRLQLSRRSSPAAVSAPGSSTAFFWHPARDSRGDADVVPDSDDDLDEMDTKRRGVEALPSQAAPFADASSRPQWAAMAGSADNPIEL